MNKKYRIYPVVALVSILAFSLITGCRSGKKAPAEDEEVKLPENITEIKQDIDQAKKIFNALPSPLESAQLIKSAGAQFDGKLLNPVSKVNTYVTSKAMALNLGVYTCDLSFASLYEQTQLLIDYMNAAKKMADGLGILDAIEQEHIDKLEENINNSEVIMEVVSQTFMNSNSYLEDNDQPATAAIVLVGGWIEGLFISTQLVDLNDFNSNKLVGRIIDQKLSIDILIDLLNRNKGNPSVDELTEQVQKLKAVFDKINLQTGTVRPEYDQASNTTLLKSEVKSDMTREIFIELRTIVAEIRNSFVN
jgi:hypothetical protein